MLARLKSTVAAYPLFYVAAALIWLKTYVVQRFYFQLPIQNVFQEMVLWINPLSSVLLMLLLAMIFTSKRSRFGIIVVSAVSSLILFANVLYYRFYSDFVTIPLLLQKSNVGGGMKSSTVDLMSPFDLLIFADILILIYLAYFRKLPAPAMNRNYKARLALTLVIVFLVNLGAAELLRPQLLTRSFDRQIIVRSIGTFNYHVYDLVLNSQMKSKKVFADTKDFEEVETFLKEMHANDQASDLFGAAKGRNVFLISMESLQSFVIGKDGPGGEEITPFLNDLVTDPSTFYFSNFYHQTGQGKTSDAEFMMDNSLYPLPSGAVYFTHAQNKFNATPAILRDRGYSTAAFHANDGSFWNRDLMYKNLGYDQYYDKEYYEVTEENSVGWGLKDVEFFQQSMPYVKDLPQPFYAKFLTLTNHHPFVLDEESQMMIEADEEEHSGLNDYFNTVRYMDGALETFFEEVKRAGLYENSVFVMYGDHYGVTPGNYDELSEFLGYEIGTFEHIKLQRTPLIIHVPGEQGRVIEDLAGQVDVKPTLMSLLGVKDGKEYDFGRNLLAPADNPFVVLRDGSFITNDYLYTSETCYANPSGEEVELEDTCEAIKEQAEKTLKMSDDIIYGDLFRFILNDKKTQ